MGWNSAGQPLILADVLRTLTPRSSLFDTLTIPPSTERMWMYGDSGRGLRPSAARAATDSSLCEGARRDVDVGPILGGPRELGLRHAGECRPRGILRAPVRCTGKSGLADVEGAFVSGRLGAREVDRRARGGGWGGAPKPHRLRRARPDR